MNADESCHAVYLHFCVIHGSHALLAASTPDRALVDENTSPNLRTSVLSQCGVALLLNFGALRLKNSIRRFDP
jgi:hypothetical protein